MKFVVVVVLAVIALVFADEDIQPGVVPVLKRDEVHDNFGQYALDFITGDGVQVQEQGALKEGAEGHVLTKKGRYQYISPEGRSIDVSYTADETGFHPQGDHLPKAHSASINS